MDWATREQGLNYIVRRDNVKISAAFCPVWSYDVNIRFVVEEPDGRLRFDWKPDLFQVYGRQSVVHVPGLATYAGYDYQRSLVNPVHNTSLVFLGDHVVPWGKWLLKEMEHPTEGQPPISISPDPWTATKGRAFAVLKDELLGISQHEGINVQIQTEVVRARRVYMPTYVFDYQVLGVEFKAFLSGADAGAGVSGQSHQVWDSSLNQHASKGLQGFLLRAMEALKTSTHTVGGQRTMGILAVALQYFGHILGRVFIRLPWIAVFVGSFVGFRKLIQPMMGSRMASAEWERQREHEAAMDEDHYSYQDDFTDSGVAQRFFQSNKTRILQHLMGTEQHERGDYDFYKDWEDWARRMYEQQHQQQHYSYHDQQQQQQRVYGQQEQQRQQKKKRPDFVWDFDPNDPYSVLGIQRGATKQQVSAAFRREMLKYHPDAQASASEAEKVRSTERSKLISEAYRKIKSEMK